MIVVERINFAPIREAPKSSFCRLRRHLSTNNKLYVNNIRHEPHMMSECSMNAFDRGIPIPSPDDTPMPYTGKLNVNGEWITTDEYRYPDFSETAW